MRAFVRVESPDGRLHELVHGDIVGRLRAAALHLDDGRVSEAHAMVSLREGELRLVALRGAFAVHGRPLSEVVLAPGQRIQLARDLELTVVDVVLPDHILAIEGDGLPRQALPGVCSLVPVPRPHLVAGWVEDADAWLWSTGSGWSVRQGDAPPRDLVPGDRVDCGGATFAIVALPVQHAGLEPTRQRGGIDAPLHLVARFDTVHVHRDGEPVLVLSGMLARIISELVSFGGPVGWQVLAGQLWPREDEAAVLRSRLDVNLSRLRRKLREARVRTDLVATDGAGSIELLTYAHDRVEDQT